MIERAARLSWEIVALRMARTWMNRFLVASAISCEPPRRMIIWWKAMLASEYSPMCSAGGEF